MQHDASRARSSRDPCPGMVYFDPPEYRPPLSHASPPGAHQALEGPSSPPLHGLQQALAVPAPSREPTPQTSPVKPPTPLTPALLDVGGAAAAPAASAVVPADTNGAADLKPLLSGFVNLWKQKAGEAGVCSNKSISSEKPAIESAGKTVMQRPAAAKRPAAAMKRPPAAVHPDAPPKKKGNLAFDPTWFKDGPPRHFGKVTVYNDRKLQLYRIKPELGSRHTKKVAWGKPDQHKEKWAQVVQWVGEYRGA